MRLGASTDLFRKYSIENGCSYDHKKCFSIIGGERTIDICLSSAESLVPIETRSREGGSNSSSSTPQHQASFFRSPLGTVGSSSSQRRSFTSYLTSSFRSSTTSEEGERDEELPSRDRDWLVDTLGLLAARYLANGEADLRARRYTFIHSS